jgi:thiosulfate dehydrogenase
VKAFLLGIVATIVGVIAGAFLLLRSGTVPVAATAPPLPFEKKLASMAQHARIDKEMPQSVPIQADEATILAGAQLYVEHCAVCHSLPGQPQTAISQGMFPKPPQLFKGKGVTDDPPGESYWKVANGIRLTGMPAFNGPLSETQMWQVTLLVANADKMSPAVKAALSPPPPSISTTPGK